MRWLLFLSVVALAGCAAHPAIPKRAPDPDPDTTAKRVEELLTRLDENPDPLHSDYTPAVRELIEIGEPAIEPTLPYLLSESPETRMHAERVVDGTILRMHGFVFGQGWPSKDDERRFRRFYKTLWDDEAMGRKQVFEAPPEARAQYVERVKRWLASRRG